MAQTGFTPISLYYTATAAATPTAGNLVAGELAINTADGKLFYKDSAGVVQTIASKNSNSGIFPAGTVSAPSITFVGDTNTGIYSPAADTIAFTEGGVESMRITDVGNVGIGNNNPTIFSGLTTLSIGGSNRGLITVRNASNADRGYIYFDSTNFSVESVGAPLNLVSPTSQPILFTTAGAERMRIDSSGNVGIGTSSPGQRLDVAGGFIRTSTNDRGLIVGSGNQAWYSGGDSGVGTGYLTLNVGSERMRISSAGDLLVGKSSSFANYRLQVVGDNVTGSRAALFSSGNSTSNGIYIDLRGTRSSDTTYTFIQCADDVATRLNVYGNGNVVNTNGSYGAISDIKLKENIVDSTSKLEKLNQVRIVNYNLIGEEQKQIGVIAQELEQIFPGMVDEAKDFNKEGKDLGTTTKSVKYSVFVPMLIKAIQELNAKVTALEAQLGAK
jgi:hypothetical protein